MDEILLANFMVFHDLVRDEDYDLWIGDEAWELTTICMRIRSRSEPRTRGSPTLSDGCRCPTVVTPR